MTELYLYIEGPMFDAFFNSEHAIGESSDLYETSNKTKHIATFNRLVGSVRVRVVREAKSRTCGDNGRDTPIGSGFDDETSGISGVCFGDVGMDRTYSPGDILVGVEPTMTYQDGTSILIVSQEKILSYLTQILELHAQMQVRVMQIFLEDSVT